MPGIFAFYVWRSASRFLAMVGDVEIAHEEDAALEYRTNETLVSYE